MADGEPPPEPPERGGRDDAAGGASNPASTPLALNDAHASQASKELLDSVGLDLEAFLQSTDLRTFLTSHSADNVFAVPDIGTRKGPTTRSGNMMERKRTERQREQRAEEADPTAATSEPTGTSNVSEGDGSPIDLQADGAQDTSSAAPGDAQGPSRKKNRTKRRGRKRKKDAADESQDDGTTVDDTETSAPTSNVWTKAREVLLRQKVEQKVSAKPDDRTLYKHFYALAEKEDYRVIPDGRPRRPMTDDELQTLYLWRTKAIHLVEPPKFVQETHTLKERLMFDQIQRDLLTYSLHIDLPGRARMPVETVKFHFYSRLLAKNQSSSGPTDQVISLMADVLSISVSATSRRAILNFDRPEKRDKWEGTVLAFPFGAVTLRAGSYFEQEDKKHGIDQDTVKLLYSYALIGRPDLAMTAVHAIALELSRGFPILKIEPVEPTGAKTLDPHMWRVTLNSVDAPPDLETTRELTVMQGEQQFTIGVHQPRLSTRPPCSACLDVSHYRNKCPNKDTAQDKRLPFMRSISIPVTKPVDHEPVADDLAGFRQQLARWRVDLEPELGATETTSTDQPDQPEEPTKPVGAQPQARPVAQKTSLNSTQLEVIIKAKKSERRNKPKKERKPKTGKPKPDDSQNDSGTAAATTLAFGKRTRIKMPAVGAKRALDEAEPQASANSGRAAIKDHSAKQQDVNEAQPPPARQQRTSRSDGINSLKPDTPRTRTTLVFEHTRPIAKQRTGQLTMTKFLPGPTAADIEPTEPDVVLLGHRPSDTPIIKLPQLLAVIDMTEVKTPGNGSCWKYALVIIQAYECGAEVTIEMKTDVAAAAKVGRTINKRLGENVKGMIADGTLDRVRLCSTVLGKVVQHNYLKQLQDHFAEAARQPADVGISRKYWGGEPEFKVFVEWVKEPLYVIDVMPDGACFPQWYHLANVRSTDGSIVQRAVDTAVTEAAFRAHMGVYKRNHVVPLVILLHHSACGDTPIGHVTAARVSNATYKHWAGSKRKQEDMKTRLQKVIRGLQGIDKDLEHHPFPSPSPPATPGSGSVYEPTDGDSAMEDDSASTGTKTATAARPPTAQVQELYSGASDSPPSFQLVATPTEGSAPWPISVLSALSLDSQPRFSPTTLDQLVPVSYASQSGLPHGEREEELIRRMQAHPPYDSSTTRQIKHVYKSNNTAYENWKARQKKEHPATYEIVRATSGPIQACLLLQDNIGALVQLVHSLPYPEVHMATVPDHVLVQAGKAASCLGQAQLIHRVQAHLTAHSQAFCTTWVDALVADTTSPDTRWHLSQATDQWKRLEQAAEKTTVTLPTRSHHGVPDQAWFKLVAYLLMVPGCLPWAFAERPLPQRCDALATWLAMVEQAGVVQSTAEAIDRRRWLAAREVFPSLDYGPPGQSPALSSSRDDLGSKETPHRN